MRRWKAQVAEVGSPLGRLVLCRPARVQHPLVLGPDLLLSRRFKAVPFAEFGDFDRESVQLVRVCRRCNRFAALAMGIRSQAARAVSTLTVAGRR